MKLQPHFDLRNAKEDGFNMKKKKSKNMKYLNFVIFRLHRKILNVVAQFDWVRPLSSMNLIVWFWKFISVLVCVFKYIIYIHFLFSLYHTCVEIKSFYENKSRKLIIMKNVWMNFTLIKNWYQYIHVNGMNMHFGHTIF